MSDVPYYGVYRVMPSGRKRYVSRTATFNRKLAEEIARDRTNGEIVLPTGATLLIKPYPHVVQEIPRASQDHRS